MPVKKAASLLTDSWLLYFKKITLLAFFRSQSHLWLLFYFLENLSSGSVVQIKSNHQHQQTDNKKKNWLEDYT